MINLYNETPAEENKDDDDDDDSDNNENDDNEERMTALYGDDWTSRSLDNLMDPKYFKEIPEFLLSSKKILQCESVSISSLNVIMIV